MFLPRAGLRLWSSCLCQAIAGTTGMIHYTQLIGWDGIFTNFLHGLASNSNPPNLCFLSSSSFLPSVQGYSLVPVPNQNLFPPGLRKCYRVFNNKVGNWILIKYTTSSIIKYTFLGSSDWIYNCTTVLRNGQSLWWLWRRCSEAAGREHHSIAGLRTQPCRWLLVDSGHSHL
jgi:hypothetical protein